MHSPEPYTIKGGDTLTSIARDHGLVGWQALYFAVCNKEFRGRHPDPDRIPAGGRILIPVDPAEQREALKIRIARLKAARQSAADLYRDEVRVIDQQFNEIKRTSQAVDAAATIALVLNSLAQLTYKGFQAMKLSEDALKVANQALAKETLTGIAKTHGRDNMALVVSQIKTESTSMVWLITKSVAQSWCDLTSPGFWANTIVNLQAGKSWGQAVTQRPEDLRQKMKQRLQNANQQALASLDKRIREAEQEMQAISSRRPFNLIGVHSVP